jgi:hypothetical protein
MLQREPFDPGKDKDHRSVDCDAEGGGHGRVRWRADSNASKSGSSGQIVGDAFRSAHGKVLMTRFRNLPIEQSVCDVDVWILTSQAFGST